MSSEEQPLPWCSREELEQREATQLAPWACHAADSRGRRVAEPPDALRTEFQRDRDRILHCTAFRRLVGKTQVFLSDAGDHYRTRLTHSLEVSQIARALARALRANEDLCEALALAHDLGHAPFGHVGGDVLHELLRDHGGFEHNRQSLRIVEKLELRNPGREGLNLSWEVRESILKHKRPFEGPLFAEYSPQEAPFLEAQLTDFADGIAYNSHDVDDALRSGLVSGEEFATTALWQRALRHARARSPEASGRVLEHKAVASLITVQITDLIAATAQALKSRGITNLAELRAQREDVVTFSAELGAEEVELRRFLHAKFYTHYKIGRMRSRARVIVTGLFTTLRENPRLLPPRFQKIAAEEGNERAIADYIAGMTDRYAQKEYALLLQPGSASLDP